MIKTKTGICFADIETSYALAAIFDLKHNDYISPENLTKDWNIYCAAFKFLDSPRVYTTCVSAKNISDDKKVIEFMREILVNTKLLVGHNLDKFDLKKFNTRLIYHKLPPIDHKILTLDTLKAARKHFSFTSNKLSYLGEFFGIGSKLPHRDGNPWLKLIKGQDVQKTLDHMVEYCVADVTPLLEQVYLRLRPYIDHPKLNGTINGDTTVYCSHCGSTDLQSRGLRCTKAGVLNHRYQCKERHCMGWTSVREKHSDETDLIFKLGED